MNAISLFTGAGIGDLGFRRAGFDFKLLTEVEKERAQLAEINFPEAEMLIGDIWEIYPDILNFWKENLRGERIDLITCTAPCQGMSKSGKGKLLREAREGRRPEIDPRNRLIIPALWVIQEIKPKWVVFENVTEMRNTVIEDADGEVRPILKVVEDSLGPDYLGEAYDVEVADYGVPQRRKRLITVFSKDKVTQNLFSQGVPLIPYASHGREGGASLNKWISVSEALAGFGPLDAVNKEKASDNTDPLHVVPVLDSKKYFWVRNTPVGKSAFDNQCVNNKCQYQGNKTHGNIRSAEGINQAKKDTPIHCQKCGEPLPRPYTEREGKRRLMSGYTSAYKRMEPNLPAPALTRNFSYACSDNKIHPYENRVISLAEAIRLQTIDRYHYKWGPIEDQKGKTKELAKSSIIRLVIGESVPPFFLELLGEHLIKMAQGEQKEIQTQTRPQLSMDLS